MTDPSEAKTTKDLLRKVETERAKESSVEPPSTAPADTPEPSSVSVPTSVVNEPISTEKAEDTTKDEDASRKVDTTTPAQSDTTPTPSTSVEHTKAESTDPSLKAEVKSMSEEPVRLSFDQYRSLMKQREEHKQKDEEEKLRKQQEPEPETAKDEDKEELPKDLPKDLPKQEDVKSPSAAPEALTSPPDPVLDTEKSATDAITQDEKHTSSLSELETPKKSALGTLSSELSVLPSSDEKPKVEYPPTITEEDKQMPLPETPEKVTPIPSDEDSDAETVHGSPVKKRGRLVRKSEMDSNTKPPKKVDFDDLGDDDEEDEDEIVPKRKKKPYGKLERASRSASPGRSHVKKPKGGRDHSGRTLLQRACEKGNYEQAKQLIEDGADVNDQDYAGNTALHEAALLGFTDIVKLLLDNGANVDIQNGPDDLDTPLIDAATNGHTDTVKMLLKYGADPRIENTSGQNALDSLEQEHADTETLRKLLREATLKLTKEGKKVESGHNSDADERSRSRSRARTGRRVPSNRAPDLLWIDFTSKQGLDEVYKRASEGDAQFIAGYLENVRSPDPEALALAAKFGHTDVVNLLLAFGTKVDAPNDKGQTALMRTVGRGHLETVKLLLDNGADVSISSGDGKSALDYARDSLLVNEDEIEMLKSALDGKPIKEPVRSHSRPEPKPEPKRDEKKIEMAKKRKLSGKEDAKDQSPEPKKKKTHRAETPTETKSNRSSLSGSASKPAEPKRVLSGSKLEKPVVKEPERPVVVAPPPETEEEKQARLEKEKEGLKRREEYNAEILAQRKAREQRFLSNFETEEKKKEEELQKLSQLEQERKEKEAKEKELKMKEQQRINDEKMKTEEVEKRKKVRELYPTGLKRATFSSEPRSKEASLRYLPLYKATRGDITWVCDVQVVMALGIEDFTSKYAGELYTDAEPVSIDDKKRLFRLMCPILGDSKVKTISKKIESDAEDQRKFERVMVHWLKYDAVMEMMKRDYPDLVSVMLAHSTFIDLDAIDVHKVIPKPVEGSRRDPVLDFKMKLPLQLRLRPSVVKCLARNKRLW